MNNRAENGADETINQGRFSRPVFISPAPYSPIRTNGTIIRIMRKQNNAETKKLKKGNNSAGGRFKNRGYPIKRLESSLLLFNNISRCQNTKMFRG